MSERQPKRAGLFVQFSGVDQELARRFKLLCEYHGTSAGEQLSKFMAEYLERHGPKPEKRKAH